MEKKLILLEKNILLEISGFFWKRPPVCAKYLLLVPNVLSVKLSNKLKDESYDLEAICVHLKAIPTNRKPTAVLPRS